MKIRTVIYIIITFLQFSGITVAQVSGYMGKRFSAKFDTYTNIYFPLEGKAPNNPFSTRKSLGIEYVIGRNVSIGTSFYFGKGYLSSMGELGNMNNKGISLGASIFSEEGLAPVGHYMRYEMIYYKSDYVIKVDDYYDILAQIQNVKSKKTGDINNVIFSLSFGQSAVLFDRVNLDYGFQLGYRFGYLIGRMQDFYGSSASSEIENDLKLRNFYHNLWGFHIGIGYLLF